MIKLILLFALINPPTVLIDKIDVGATQDLGGPKCGNKPEGCPACFICNFNTGACVADENCKVAPNQDAQKTPKPKTN